MKKLSIIILVLMLFESCSNKRKETPIIYDTKIISAKTTTIDGEYLIAFEDLTSMNFSFGIYSMAEIGDTLVFNCYGNKEVNVLSCSFVEIKHRYTQDNK